MIIRRMKTLEKCIHLPEGPPCHVVVTRYSNNKVLVVVSNTGTFGSIVHAEKESSLRGGVTYNVSMALGDRNDSAPELCARMVLESAGKTWGGETVFPSFVFCLGIQRQCLIHKQNLRTIAEHIVSDLHGLYTNI